MEEIEQLLPKNLEELMKASDTFKRKRTVKCACDLLKVLFLYAVSGYSFKMLAFCAHTLGISEISDTVWRKKMQKAQKWLQEILNQQLHTILSLKSSSSLGIRDVYLIDDSTIRQQGEKQKQACIHMCYHLNTNCMQEVKVTDNHVVESFSHFSMKKGDIIIADVDYGISSNICFASEQEADVICRITPNHLNIWDENDEKINLRSFLKEAKKRSKSKEDSIVELSGFVTDKGKKVWVRLIACRLPEEKILMAQQKKKRKSSKNSATIKVSTLEYAELTLLVTTLGIEYGKEEILHLYRSRWQVELLFKRIKQNLRIQTV